VPSEPRGYRKFAKKVKVKRAKFPVVDLFCGAGGATLGAVWAGFYPTVAVDIDPAAIETFLGYFCEKLKFRAKVFCEDARKFVEDEKRYANLLDEPFVLIGCPPCQGFSTSGKRRENDARNDLIYAYLKFVKKTTPVVVTFENVFGMRNYSKYSRALVEGLKSLGYEIVFGVDERGNLQVIDLAYYGVPQHRRRVVVVATRSKKFAKAFEPPLPFRFSRYYLKKYGYDVEMYYFETVREWIGDLPPLKSGETHPSVPNHRAPNLSELTLKRIKAVPKNGGSLRDAPKDLWIPCHRTRPNAYKDVLGRLKWDEPAVTIRASFAKPTTGRYVHPEQDRSLSMREGARLQTFPDDFVFPNFVEHCSRLIGNALPPRFSYILSKEILKALEVADLA
jgi:DNA (cytosine-5)-methyltransferase 1